MGQGSRFLKAGLTPLEDALATILAGARPSAAETVSLAEALGRVAAEPIAARFASPQADLSAMDGYALRAADLAGERALRVVGEAPAGRPFDRGLAPGEAARIFTGGWLPAGADAILIQENALREGDLLRLAPGETPPPPGAFVRRRGLDFAEGERLIQAGVALDPLRLGLAAVAGHGALAVRKRPIVAIAGTGDELTAPGVLPGPGQTPSSNNAVLAAMVEAWGGEARDLGAAPDDLDAIGALADAARGADLFLVTGGASVGAYDLVAEALAPKGLERAFWRIAMRPGKPLSFGRLGDSAFLGLPGNPVSTAICAIVFVRPFLRTMLGLDPAPPLESGVLAAPMPENDQRADHVRAVFAPGPDHAPRRLLPASRQDSSMTRTLADSDALVLRAPFAPAAAAGDVVRYLPLAALFSQRGHG